MDEPTGISPETPRDRACEAPQALQLFTADGQSYKTAGFQFWDDGTADSSTPHSLGIPAKTCIHMSCVRRLLAHVTFVRHLGRHQPDIGAPLRSDTRQSAMHSYTYALHRDQAGRFPIGGPDLPLGSVIVACLRGSQHSLLPAIGLARENPWCTICLCCPTGSPIAGLLQSMPIAQGVAFIDCISCELHPERIQGYVPNDKAPAPNDVIEYVVRRTGRHSLFHVLSSCLSAQDTTETRTRTPKSTLSRQLSQHGPLTCRDWNALYQTVTNLIARSGPGADAALAIDSRTLRGRCKRLFGYSPTGMIASAHWRWWVEASLRRWGYVSSIKATPAKVTAPATRQFEALNGPVELRSA
jgi:hypothetical protein